jgi:hypothetical protein
MLTVWFDGTAPWAAGAGAGAATGAGAGGAAATGGSVCAQANSKPDDNITAAAFAYIASSHGKRVCFRRQRRSSSEVIHLNLTRVNRNKIWP